jgi:hypothetical protein
MASQFKRASCVVAGPYDPEFAEAVTTSLKELSSLPANWDGYGGRPIDPEIIKTACAFVRALPENLALRPQVVPMSAGNLQLEWHKGPKILELEFETPTMIRYLQWHPEEGVEEEDVFLTADVAKADVLIRWFMNGISV